MPYSTNLTDAEWEVLSPLLSQILPLKKKTRPPNWTRARNFKWHLLSTQEWLQLGRPTKRFTSLLNRILALQTVALSRCA
jgi:hypothetical protein